MIARGARRAGVGLGFDRAGLSAAATAAVGLIVRTLALQVVLVVTTAVAARQGDAAIAAHQVAFRVWMLLALALDPIAIAGQAITGPCPGAGDLGRGRGATRRQDRRGAGGAGRTWQGRGWRRGGYTCPPCSPSASCTAAWWRCGSPTACGCWSGSSLWCCAPAGAAGW